MRCHAGAVHGDCRGRTCCAALRPRPASVVMATRLGRLRGATTAYRPGIHREPSVRLTKAGGQIQPAMPFSFSNFHFCLFKSVKLIQSSNFHRKFRIIQSKLLRLCLDIVLQVCSLSPSRREPFLGYASLGQGDILDCRVLSLPQTVLFLNFLLKLYN
jgi:hypothetical protein